MTTTTLATAGTLGLTAAGGYLFGPLGAGAGALVGSFLFGGSGQKVEGPRLGDLSVAASTYGGVIPVGFGTQKVAGTIIWATDIREEKHTNTQGGGLFGGGTKVVEYRYFASFAVALGEGPAGAVTRIWAGDKLIARLRSSDHAKANHPKYRFRIYLGTEDQQPDPRSGSTSRRTLRRRTAAWSPSCSRTCRSTSSATGCRRSRRRCRGPARRMRWPIALRSTAPTSRIILASTRYTTADSCARAAPAAWCA
jgi:hypothetical protein